VAVALGENTLALDQDGFGTGSIIGAQVSGIGVGVGRGSGFKVRQRYHVCAFSYLHIYLHCPCTLCFSSLETTIHICSNLWGRSRLIHAARHRTAPLALRRG
jgi:hypothetical protein